MLCLSQVYTEEPIIIAILSFCCAYCLYKIIVWLKRSKPHATVLLEISAGHQCVLFPIMNVPCCPKFLHFQSDTNIGEITINKNILKPVVTIDWEGLTISNLLTDKAFPLSDQLPVAPWTGAKLRSLLNNPYHAFIVCAHDNYTFYTRFCTNNCTTCAKHFSDTNVTV